MQIYRTTTSTTYFPFIHISWFMWMSQVVIKGQDLGGLAGLLLV